MSDEIKKYPKVTVGAYIVNKNGEILMIRSPKWGDRLLGPGGHIEYGETAVEAVKREVKEETGLDVTDIELLTPVEVINSDEFTIRRDHFVCLDHRAKLVDENQEIKLDVREGLEYLWLKSEDIIKRNDIERSTKAMIEKYFINKDKKNIFHKSCKDCEKIKIEAEEYKNNWHRALADYKNLQREIEQRRSEWAQMSEVQIIEDFLPVYDNFKKAFATEETGDSWRQGIGYIMKQFADVLKVHNIEEIKTVGERFNPNLHDAAGEALSSDGVQESGTIVREVSGGYRMGDRVIRAARVIVVK